MYTYYIIAIIASILIIAAGLTYYYIINSRKPTPISPQNHIMQKEVFLVKVFGAGNLGNGELNAPYMYASPEQINAFIKTGLRNSDVKRGDYILYRGINPTQIPNSTEAQDDYFKNSDSIEFDNRRPSTQVTYWVALYGYKPLKTAPWWQIFQWSSVGNSVGKNSTFMGIEPFNQRTYLCPQTYNAINSDGDEVFWLMFDSQFSPTSTDEVNSILLNGYKLATLEQYAFSFSKGLGDGFSNSVYVSSDDGSSVIRLGSVLDKSGDNSGLRPCTSDLICDSFNTTYPFTMFAIWGDKNEALNNGVGYISTRQATIIPFNKDKKSQYN